MPDLDILLFSFEVFYTSYWNFNCELTIIKGFTFRSSFYYFVIFIINNLNLWDSINLDY
jgi:hypothetical protein